jgi:hypothetical protein
VLDELENALMSIVTDAGLDAERWRNGDMGKIPIDFD